MKKQFKFIPLPFEVGKSYKRSSPPELLFTITKIVMCARPELGINFFMGKYEGEDFESMIHGSGLVPEKVKVLDLPEISTWFICYVDNERLMLRFNAPNQFWVGHDGRTYHPERVIWVDDLS